MSESQRPNHTLPRPSDRIDPSSELPESSNPKARQQGQQGDDALNKGDLDTAEAAYVAALKIDPNDIRACHNLGVAIYRAGRWEDALDCFAHCLKRDSDRADLHFKWGICALKCERIEDAQYAFAQAIALDTDHLRARFQLALLYARGAAPGSEDRREAIAHLDYILEANDRVGGFPLLDRVCFLLGSLLDDFPDNAKRAIAVYRRGLQVDSLFAPGHNNLGVLLMQAGQILPALGELKIAIQLEPDYTLPYGNLARLLFNHMSPRQMETEFANITEEFGATAPTILSRLSLELIDLGRVQVYESLYTHGHRIKNLMGLSGSRLRRLMRKLPPDVQGRDDLHDIAHEQEHIYNQWVAYLRSMKQDAMNLSLVDVPRLIRQTTENLSPRAGETTLTFVAENHVPQVKADAGMLSEAVTNLVLNAVEAAGENGRVIIQVGLDSDRNSVFIEIEDNGPGISEDLQTRIFDPGFSTRERGNGYGLSICGRIASAHRGTLRVISQSGAGAVFRIDLPIDFEVSTEGDSIGLQRSATDAASGPLAEEFIH